MLVKTNSKMCQKRVHWPIFCFIASASTVFLNSFPGGPSGLKRFILTSPPSSPSGPWLPWILLFYRAFDRVQYSLQLANCRQIFRFTRARSRDVLKAFFFVSSATEEDTHKKNAFKYEPGIELTCFVKLRRI